MQARTRTTITTLATIAAMIAAAAAIAAIIGLRGDFPLSDDWAYAYAARGLCEQGELHFLPWTGASLIFQVWYGALLCKIFGFSFTALRISTFALAVFGVVGFYLMLRRLNIRQSGAVAGAALLGLNPIYLNLSFTYMSDVPFTVLAIWAGYHYVRGLSEDRRILLVAGALFAAAAALVRQHGVFLAGAASLTALLAQKPFRTRIVDALICSALPLAALAAFQMWLIKVHGLPSGMENKISEALSADPWAVGNAAFRGLLYLGLMLFPAAWALSHPAGSNRRLMGLATFTVALSLCSFLYQREGALMFYLTNIMDFFSLGAISLRDVHFLGFPYEPQAGPIAAVILTGIASLGWALLAGPWFAGLRHWHRIGRTFCVLAFSLLFLGSLLQAHYYFDRYLIPMLPFALAAAFAAEPRLRINKLCYLLTALIAAYSIAGTHDYMAWNRARFEGLALLEAEGVSAREIDGGMEYNGWHSAADFGHWPSDEEARPGQPASRKSWWWVYDDRFIAAFRKLDGYRVKYEMPYDRWLPPSKASVFILERNDG